MGLICAAIFSASQTICNSPIESTKKETRRTCPQVKLRPAGNAGRSVQRGGQVLQSVLAQTCGSAHRATLFASALNTHCA